MRERKGEGEKKKVRDRERCRIYDTKGNLGSRERGKIWGAVGEVTGDRRGDLRKGGRGKGGYIWKQGRGGWVFHFCLLS